jgi:hypothetical protein
MKKQVLSLIFVIIASIGFSQTYPMLTKTSNMTPTPIMENDTILVPVGDSVWIGGIDAWNASTFGHGNGSIVELANHALMQYVDTVYIGNNDKLRFKVTTTTKQKYIIYISTVNPERTFYIRGTVGMPTGIGSHNMTKSNLKAYPNPVSDNLTVSFESATHDQKVSIFDLQGRLVMENTDEREIGTNTLKLDVMPLNAGIYFVRVGAETYKITKQ